MRPSPSPGFLAEVGVSSGRYMLLNEPNFRIFSTVCMEHPERVGVSRLPPQPEQEMLQIPVLCRTVPGLRILEDYPRILLWTSSNGKVIYILSSRQGDDVTGQYSTVCGDNIFPVLFVHTIFGRLT